MYFLATNRNQKQALYKPRKEIDMKQFVLTLAALILISANAWAEFPQLVLPMPVGETWILTRAYDAPPTHVGSDRYALDFSQPGCEAWDKPIFVAAPGIVDVRPFDPDGYGYHLYIDHGDGYRTHYAHLRENIVVEDGQQVYHGTQIGNCGNSGNTSGQSCPEHPGTHLHFKMLYNGDPVKPEPISGYSDFPDGEPQTPYYVPPYSLVGYYADGWHPDTSPKFLDKYNAMIAAGHPLGTPWDNGGSVYVHTVDDMDIQDFFGEDNGYYHPYTALILGHEQSDFARLLKEGFWDVWMNNAGWVSFGPPVTNEYPIAGEIHQTFRKNGELFDFVWDDVEIRVYDWEGNPVVLRNITVTTGRGGPRSQDSGVYHSDLLVSEFDIPFDLIEGQIYDGFYAMVGGEQIWIDSFTVDGDMVIVVESDDGRPIADFRADPVIGSSPLSVWFSDESIGDGIDWWYWQFGDGHTSTNRHPNHVYEQPGVYTVSLLVSTPQYSDYVERVDYITVVEPVQAIGSFEILNPWAPDAVVQFTNLSTGGHGEVQVLWNFDDGNTSSEQNPEHTYTAAGDYVVRLDVSDAYSSDFTYLPLHIAEHVVPDFTADVTEGVAPLTVEFTDLTVGNPNRWDWDFGDGAGLCCTEPNPVYIYETPGIYSVRLDVENADESDYIIKKHYITVIDSSGCSGNGGYRFDGFSQHLSVGGFNSSYLGSETTVEGWVCLDRNNVVQNIYSHWNVSDHKVFNLYVDADGHFVGEYYGNPSAMAIGSTVLQVGEWYYLALVAKDGEVVKVYVNGELDNVSPTILVEPNTTMALGGRMATQEYNGEQLDHLQGSLDEWRLSKVARTAEEIETIYTSGLEMEIDEHTVNLWHMNGEVGTAEKQEDASGSRDLNEVYNPEATSGFNECVPPIANFIAEPVSGLAPLTVQFTDLSVGDGIDWWYWQFGDGSTSSEQHPVHIYEEPGIYSVSLLVSTPHYSDYVERNDYIIVEDDAVVVAEGSVYAFALHHNHPNPFNPVTTISYQVKETCRVKLSIYDLAGSLVTTLVDQVVQTGAHQTIFNGQGFSSGVYFYKLETPAGTWTRKMTLVK